jgi:hypothetical protein
MGQLQAAVTKFVNEFNRTYVLVKGFIDHCAKKARGLPSVAHAHCATLDWGTGVLDG